MKFLLFSIFGFFAGSIRSQIESISPLQLKEIMTGNEYIGYQPEQLRWSVDGETIVFDWRLTQEGGAAPFLYSLAEKNYSKATPEQRRQLLSFSKVQKNYEFVYFSIEGALVEYEQKTKKSVILYQTDIPIHAVQRISNSENVYFQQANNLFLYDKLKGSVRQITNFKKGETVSNIVDSSYLIRQQETLFQFIKDAKKENEWNTTQTLTRYPFPSIHFYGAGSLEALQISADGRFVTFRIENTTPHPATQVEHYISKDGNTFTTSARSKVSVPESSFQIGIYSIERDSTYYVNFSQLSDIRKKASYLLDYDSGTNEYATDRTFSPSAFLFSKNGKHALLQLYSHDHKDRWIVDVDLNKGLMQEIDKQHDEAWIGGPGITDGTIGWFPNGETFYFQSEVSGYSHLYTYNFLSKKKTALTDGKWEVHRVALSENGKTFFLTANKNHPGNREFYHLDIATRKLTPVLTNDGFHEVVVSPDEKTLAVRFSSKNKPWELFIAPNTPQCRMIPITKSTTKKFEAYPWREPSVITFKGSDGIDVYARLYSPVAEVKNNAAILFVHGAGYLQNAHNYWSSYYREYMFHNLLADNGFTVLDIDYRASEGYGRDCRTAIYRHMGGRDLQDHLDGKKYLVDSLGVDSNRVGIYGGSYGGFITLMALLTEPKAFSCGAALRSVTDWAHYNQGYTSNILNTPETDPLAFRRSSPIYFAENLQSRLLMLHGMVDDNVQFQDVVRLSQRFIELDKNKWELAVFPVEAHGFQKSSSWNDEYKRIYNLFYEELVLPYLPSIKNDNKQ
jgi:dipeptidyl aminopeptidase/acylaminoacyl peptidase